MIVGYARVSTKQQGLEMQLDALKSAGCDQVYSEKEGSAKNRPELTAALRSLRKGDVFVVWKLDRMARSLRELVDLVNQVHSAGAEFRSLTQAIDTTSPAGKLTFQIFGAIAEFERDLIRERTIEGMKSARARGRRGGRKPKLRTEQHKLVLDKYEAGYTYKQLSGLFECSTTVIKRALTNARKARGEVEAV